MPIAPNMLFPSLVSQNGDDRCRRILITAEDEDVRSKAKLYVENFMLGSNPLLAVKRNNAEAAPENKTNVLTFKTSEEMEEEAKKNDSANCFGLNFIKVDTAKFDYEVMYSFNQFRSVDTNKPLFTDLISKPDMGSWDQAQRTAWIYPYITDFLAKY